LRPSCLASLASLGFVLETFVGEKHLLAGSKDEFSPTFRALQNLVVVFHTMLRDLAGKGPEWDKTGEIAARASQWSGAAGTQLLPARWMAQYCSEELLFDVRLVLLTPLLFAETLTREGFFGPTSFPGFHIVAVLLDFLDDVFRLHLTFKSSERILQRLTLLNDNLCHAYSPPFPF
jgi:hypothetical protein